jgi:hypothetical protein
MSASASDVGTEKGARRTFDRLGCAKRSIASRTLAISVARSYSVAR